MADVALAQNHDEGMLFIFWVGGGGGAAGKVSVAYGRAYWLWWSGEGWVYIVWNFRMTRSAVLTEAGRRQYQTWRCFYTSDPTWPTGWKFHRPNTVHCTIIWSVVKESCFYIADAERFLQQPIAQGTYSSSQVTLSITTKWRNDSELPRVYMTLFHSKQTI